MRHDDVYEIICSTDTPIIIAKSKKDEVKVAPFKDVKNGAVVLSNAIKNVFSPISGASLERQGLSFETLSSDDMKEMKEVAHCKCGATLLTTAELADKLDKHSLHCVVCGQEIEPEEDLEVEEEEIDVDDDEDLEESSDEAEESEDMDDMPEDDSDEEIEIEDEDIEESSDDEEPAEDLEEDEEIEIDVDDDEDEDLEESSDELADEEDDVDVEDDAESEEEIDDAEDELDVEESCDEADDADDMPEDEDSDEGVELEIEEDEQEEEQACVKFNCLSAVDKIHNLELVKCESGYRVLVNGNPVASAFKEQASESLNPLFDDVRALTKAMSAAISEEGFSNEVKASFGIKPLMVKVPMDTAAKQKYDEIQASVRESISKEYEKKHEDFMQRFNQSMTIASVGVNKGLYGTNLLTQSLIKSLAASGQEDAEDVVNEIMSKYGESYLKEIIEKAQELVSKSDEVRNETASLVKAATFSKSKAVNLAHTAVEPKVEVSKPVETTASTNKYSDLF